MFSSNTQKLAAAVALNILADAFSDRAPARMQAEPAALPGDMPLGFVEYTSSEFLYTDDFRKIGQTRDAIHEIEKALPWTSGDMHLDTLKKLLRDIYDNVRKDTWAAVKICTGMMCFPGQTRDCVKVVYVLNDGTTRSATWIKK